MNNSNLIVPTSEQAREYGRRGGQVRSVEKRIAAKLTWMKRKGLSDEDAVYLLQMMKDPEVGSLNVLQGIQSLEKEAKFFDQKEKVHKLKMDWFKMKHKSSIESQVNIQNNTFVDKVYEFRIVHVNKDVPKEIEVVSSGTFEEKNESIPPDKNE